MAERENRLAASSGGLDPRSVDDALVLRLLARDVDAFERIYERHSPRVYALCQRMLRNREHAEEVLQDAFWQLWERPERFDPSRGKLVTFIFQIARSRCLDRLRRDRRRAATQFVASGELEVAGLWRSEPTPLQSAFVAEERAQVQEALDALPVDSRAVLLLAYFEGLSQTEISDRLGVPVGTVKSRARRGLLRLRALLDGEAGS